MMKRPEICDMHRLDLFLHNRLSEEYHAKLEAHLLVCPACRQRLDDLAGGSGWWTEVRRHLGSDGRAESLPNSDEAALSHESSMDLGFLRPSDNPALLGRLGGYEVLEVLGQGGMGVVLKAFDPALHRPVAIKVLAADYAANGAARKRFAREAQAVAAVIHDHVVPIHAIDAQATPPYLVMAFIPGQSLQQRIDQSGPLELKEVLRIGMQTAAGLAAAHAQGLVHRDIKPANIMLENGIERVRITDFGLARAVGDASVTQSGAVTGTPQYMAPEQAGGEPVDQRADLFALGSTLYAMCTGQAPFRGSSHLAVIRQVCDREPTPVRMLNPDVPEWLEGMIRKLHAKDPAKRFQSAAEVADLLERCLAHVQQPNRHPLPPPAVELGRFVSRAASQGHTAGLRTTIRVLAVSILGAVMLLLMPRPPSQTLDKSDRNTAQASADPAVAEDGPINFDDWRPDTERLQGQLDSLRQSFWTDSSGEPAGAEPALGSVRQRAELLDRSVRAATELCPDPVDLGIEIIRRQLGQFRQQFSKPVE
ncbi:MAG TPA: protein kinase [Gemmataceae bacterium]|nr:protein kinase [Gemmataceae bacterium]